MLSSTENTIVSTLPLLLPLVPILFALFFRKSKFLRIFSFVYLPLFSAFVYAYRIFVKANVLNIEFFTIKDIEFNIGLNFGLSEMCICLVIMIILTFVQCANLQMREKIDHDKHKYQIFLNIFASIMCFTVLSNNIFNFFIGMELLGLTSSILVGFEEKSTYEATKIFLLNKFSSILFLISVIIIVHTLKTTELLYIRDAYEHIENYPMLRLPAWLLLISCLCKSAQFPFSSWIVDSTKANIFVSILIHAATIVGFGVIFISKCFFIFEAVPILKQIMVVSGGATAILMTLSSFFHTNIKKIIACSTAASIGLMFIACGLGEYSVSLLYFLCHAFSKSLFFLSFAYVIKILANETNILKMGGISDLIPHIKDIVWLAFLSTVGFPFFVSFFAKSSLLSILFDTTNTAIGFIVVFINIASITTSFRLIMLSLYGKTRVDSGVLSRIKDIPSRYMSVPLTLTAISILGSFFLWAMCEWELLHFGNGGTVYLRTFIDYLIENIIEIMQIILSALVTYIIFNIIKAMSTKANYKISELFTKHEITAYLLDKLAVCSQKCLVYIAQIDQRFNISCDNTSNKIVNISSVGISRLHKDAIHCHAYFIFFGVIACMLYLLFVEYRCV